MSREGRLYDKLARYYDQIYHWKDYRKEAREIKKLIKRYKRSPGNRLVDVACGTGKHIQNLTDEYDCVGVDVSGPMLAQSRKNLPGVRFVRGDMLDFNLRTRCDVVLCLFSSMGYLTTAEDVDRTISNFARHMEEGAVLIIEPWLRESVWTDRSVHLQTYADDSLKIARASFVKKAGKFSLLDERYLIAEKG